MKFVSESIGALFFGGLLGILLWATFEGVTISGVPGPLVAMSFGVLACAWVSIWWRKGQDDLARAAGACFTAVVVGFPILGAFIGGDTGPVEGQLFDPRLLLPLMKWVMVVGLMLTTILSLVSIYVSQNQSHVTSVS
jgi:hypothetical protein